jgi:predicted nucleic acid-binding protein
VSTRHLRGLVDTNILIHLDRLPAGQLPAELLTSAITLAELSAGVHQTDDAAERGRRIARLQRVEAIFEPLPFDVEAARQYGVIVAGVITAGRKPRRREADLMIAAIAAAHRLPLYTTNPDDFLGAEGAVEVIAVERPAIA